MFKTPFRVPFAKQANTQRDENEPPSKKRRVDTPPANATNHAQAGLAARSTSTIPSFRKPNASQHASSSSSATSSNTTTSTPLYFNVLYRKFTAKKHKTWDGDGILLLKDGYAFLQDVNGTAMGKTTCARMLEPGANLTIGGKEVEVDSVVDGEDVKTGRMFLGTANKPTVREVEEKCRVAVRFNGKVKEEDEDDEVVEVKKPMATFRAPVMKNPALRTSSAGRPSSGGSRPVPAQGQAPQSVKAAPPAATQTSGTSRSMFNPSAEFKNPVLDKSLLAQVPTELGTPTPRHDPDAPGAIVMKRPTSVPRGKQIVDVVIDPFVASHLRDHQKEGVKFMYECVMGMRESGVGAILADEMGLGKTLQVIALLWTLLKQNPIYNEGPVIKKALIVCPVTLIKNWRKEFVKWLGRERLGVLVVDDNKVRVKDFTKGKAYSVMIVGYEKLRTIQDDLRKGNNIDIVIADEGHRLKTAKNKSAEAIKSLSTDRRIILSGTPMQNDLSEFYTMVDFVNPGLLGKANTFKKEFELPILKSRQPGVSEDDKEKGEARSEELARLTSVFILRRSADLLAQYLPPKSEYIVFCEPVAEQARLYRDILASPIFGAVLGSTESALQLINILKKVCNSPALLLAKEEGEQSSASTVAALRGHVKIPPNPGTSGKWNVLDDLLVKIYLKGEKVVLVSHYTSTLDMLANLVTSYGYQHLRLDGKTPANKRQELVDTFNRTDYKRSFAFLLSAKSGGTGLNLIGASRLILFDTDWNPATDLQAMARIHRDGQKHPCKIYRLLTRGALDEKIYQRQVSKLSLADSVVDNKTSSSTFTREELRKLFSLDESSICQTHDLLRCDCGGRGDVKNMPAPVIDSELPSEAATPEPATSDQEDVVIDLTAASPEALDDDIDAGAKVTKGDLDSDSDDELPPVGALIKASQIERQERAIRNGTAKYFENERFKHPGATKSSNAKDQKETMLALMQYDHIDAAAFRPPKRMAVKGSMSDDVDEEKDRKQEEMVQELTGEEKEALVEDDVLRAVMTGDESMVRYVFARTTG